MEFNKREIFAKTEWKSKSIGVLPTKTIKPEEIAPTRMGSGKSSDGKPKVVFGITKSPKAETIKVNWEVPNFKKFQIQDEDYVLWYIIIQTNEMNIDKVKITSDAVYISEGKQKNMIFRKAGNVVIVKTGGSSKGNLLTSYGPDGARGSSGAEIFWGTPDEPGKPITHEALVEGKVPIPSGGTLPPAKQIIP